MIVDTTGSQYRELVNMKVKPVDLKGFSSTSEKRLSDKATNNHYQLLKKTVVQHLVISDSIIQ